MQYNSSIKIENARKIVDLRNWVIHGYDRIDDVIIVGIVSRQLPILKEQVDELLKIQFIKYFKKIILMYIKSLTKLLLLAISTSLFANTPSLESRNDSLMKKMLKVEGANWQVDYPQFYKPPFKILEPDSLLSPYTGMTRQEWIRCGIHILEGAFQYVDSLKQPMLLPKFLGKSYPSGGIIKPAAAILEATARTFNVAAPILAENPNLVIHNIKLIDYYKYHLLQILTNPNCEYFIGYTSDYNYPYQPTCELGNLSVWNLLTPNVFWNRLNNEEKDKVAAMVSDWSKTYTFTHNWRYFDVMMMTFLNYYGYEINPTLMNAHLDNLISLYAGNGWYRDHSYDYYSVHVFNMYNNVWLEKYGRKNEPGRASVIEQQMKEFYINYPLIFGRNAEINMYGRSVLYRLGASACMPAAFIGNVNTQLTPGLARRVASGALLQFVTHPKFFSLGIPSLGFYGPFDHCIQPYSCSASPYWMFNSFIALTLPSNHPFWTAKEEMGHWGLINKTQAYTKYLNGMGMLVTNFGTSGASEVRPGKIHNTDPNYSRLVYNTSFPWEAASDDGVISSAITMLLTKNKGVATLPTYIDVEGYRDSVLYRQAAWEFGSLHAYTDMASIVIPYGEIRIERVRKVSKSKYYLGHFSLPHLNETPKIEYKTIDGKASIIASINNRMLAITNYIGWHNIDIKEHTGLHPECEKSTLLYAQYSDTIYEYGPIELLISVLLHSTTNTFFSNNQLQPISKVEALKTGVPLHLGGLKMTLKAGNEYIVDFKNIDGVSSRH